MSGAELIAAERSRQLTSEEGIGGSGWTEHHDDLHVSGEMVEAAIVYERCALTIYTPRNKNALAPMPEPPTDWPWQAMWFKPTWDDPVRCLVKAGALIAAEIDRLQRRDTRERAAGGGTPA
jgi:hypothetical protein